MPGTRYSSNFDSIERWQGASLPANLPLNGSYKHYARSASTDSLDSSGTGTTISSSHCGAGHSRKVSMEGPSESTRTGIKTPMVNHNPWQFVKVDPVPLYKKVVDQMNVCQENKTIQDCKKEEEELWQKKLNSWKSRRKKVTEKTIQRVEDLKLLQQETNQIQGKSKTKTFSEILENRAQKPRFYNLSIHGENDCKHEDSSYVFEARRKSEPSVKQNDITNQDLIEPDPQEFTFSNIKDKFEILEEDSSDNPKEDSAICMEDDCESCGRFTMDLGLESSNCSQRVGETRDRPSELSLDISEDYGKPVNEYEFSRQSSIKQGERSEPNAYIKLSKHLQDIQQADSNVHLSMRLWLNSDTEETDFGFKIREENGIYLVDELKYKGIGMQSGLKLNDQILAVNEKNTSGRTRNSILFSMKQSVYNGYLDLLIYRSQNEVTKESGNTFGDSVNGEDIFGHASIVNSQNAIRHIQRNDETFGDIVNTNILNGDFQSSQISKEPEPRVMKGSIIKSTPTAVENLSSSFIVGENVSEKKLEKTYSNEMFKFSSPTSFSGVSEELRCGEKELDQQLLLGSRLHHTAAEKNVSQVLSASPSSVIEDRCGQLQSKRLYSTSDFDDTQQEETKKVSDDFDYCYLNVAPPKETPSPSEGSPKQKSPSCEIKSDPIKRSYDFFDINSTDDHMDNDEKKLLTTDTQDTLSLMNNNEQSECVQYKQCQADEKPEGSLLGKIPILKDEEKLFKKREESLFRRKKEIELEMKSLLWEEYNLQKEKEEYRRRVLLEQGNAHEIPSSSGIKLRQL